MYQSEKTMSVNLPGGSCPKLCNLGLPNGSNICRDQIGFPPSNSGHVRPSPIAFGPAMLIRLVNFQTATIVLLSVIVLFFFPAPRGSFVSTHGPMTTLRMRCESALFWIGLALISARRIFAVTLTTIGIWLRTAVSGPPLQEVCGFCVLRI